MNAANEVAVESFLAGRTQFLGIPELIERTMDLHQAHALGSIADVLAVDAWARVKAKELVKAVNREA
jgi:1-deoxy-D-xylulose-5-phosphate reductoisomerase